jgi:membrane protease YdiL (CAAX protease family)
MDRRSIRTLILAAAFEAGLGVLGAVAALFAGVEVLALLRLDAGTVAVGLAAAAPMVLLFIVAIDSSWEPLARIRRILTETLVPHLAGIPWWGILVLSVFAGLGEELLFRGFLQSALSGVLPPAAALVVASVVFGLAHWITRAYAVFATLLGAYLGLLFLLTESLLAPVLCHAAYDLVALLVYMRRHNLYLRS